MIDRAPRAAGPEAWGGGGEGADGSSQPGGGARPDGDGNAPPSVIFDGSGAWMSTGVA